MEIQIRHRAWRTIGWLVLFGGFAIGCGLSIGVFCTGGELWIIPIALLVCSLTGSLWGLKLLIHSPKLYLSRGEVRAKRFFRVESYHWRDFIQAGTTWTHNRGIYYHEIVLLLPGGRKRQFRDDFFYIRNFFRIIYLPYRDDVLRCVTECYGKLDFCFLNGTTEESLYTIEEISE